MNLEIAVKQGLKYLIAIRLPFSPSLDDITAQQTMVRAWISVLEPLRNWDEANCHTLLTGFKRTGAIAKQWPSPALVYENTPKPQPNFFKALPEPARTAEEKRAIDDICADLFKQLKMPQQPMPQNPKTRTVKTANSTLIYTEKE